MCLNHPELLHKHPALLVSPVTMYIVKVRYSRTHYLCDDVVRVGSMRFDVLEPPRTNALNLLKPHHCRYKKVCTVL